MSAVEKLDDTASLFEPGGLLSAAALADMRAHPGFPAALRTLSAGMLALYRGNRLLNVLINDRGRMIIGYLALYLNERGAPDGRGGGFGIGQLKALCAAARVASPGRTTAMLALMRMSGHIASASAPEDRRRHILVPTEKLRAAHRDRWEHVAATLREVKPDAAAGFALDDPEFVAAYVRHTADLFLGGVRFVDLAPEMELFLDRNAGLMILFSLVLAGTDDDTIPPRHPVPISISAIANRFGISRVHVRTVLRDAEAQGLIERTGKDGSHVLIRPGLAAAVETYFAATILFTAHCALQAAADARART